MAMLAYLHHSLCPRFPSLRLRSCGSSHIHFSSSALTFPSLNPRYRRPPPFRHIARARTEGQRRSSDASPPPPSERKSLAVATGELILGLASAHHEQIAETHVEDHREVKQCHGGGLRRQSGSRGRRMRMPRKCGSSSLALGLVFLRSGSIPPRERIHLGKYIMDLSDTWRSVRPYLAMIFLQFGYAGMYIVSVASLKHGMSHYVLVVYRNALAAAIIGPFALWFERKGRPKMTLWIFLKVVALALLEPVLDQNFYYLGTKYTSASFSSALYNVLPAMTFINALILRMEKVDIKRRHSQAKIVGTLVTVIGALVMILYKGPIVEFLWNKGRSHHTEAASQDETHWLVGTFMLLFSCFCWSLFFILQSNTLKSYPAELSLSFLICIMGTLLGSSVALILDPGVKPWIIGFDTRLVAAVYSAIMCTGLAYYLQAVVVKERGPVFVTAFSPLCLVIVTVMGSIILAEEITLGRLIGAVVIVIGLYSLIWGKSNDHMNQSPKTGEKQALELPKTVNDDMISNSMNCVSIQNMSSAKKP